VAAQERLREVLLQQTQHLPVGRQDLVPAAKLEHRLRLDHEQMLLAFGIEPEANVLLDLHLLLLDEEEWSAFLGRARCRDADPVLVRDRPEDLLHEKATRRLDFGENLLGSNGAH
jgi:hypothetical protein